MNNSSGDNAAGAAVAAHEGSAAPLDLLPPAPPRLQLPVTFTGKWRRDWRVRGELVGRGAITLSEQGVQVRGRRTTPPRSVLRAIVRLAFWCGLLAGAAFVLLTSTGLAFRSGAPQWLLMGPLLGLPGLWLTLWIPAVIVRWLSQPKVKRNLPWSAVERMASDGFCLEVLISLPDGVVWGRLKPRWWGRRKARIALREIRDGGLPEVAATVTTRRPRSAWWDRAALVAGVLVLLGGAKLAQQYWPQSTATSTATAAAVAPSPAALTVRAQQLASSPPMIPAGATASQATDALTARATTVWAALRRDARGARAIAQVDQGFLAGVPWGALLSVQSMAASLPRFELARQRLDGTSPSGTLGRRFLFDLAQAFLDSTPPARGSWSARVDVAEAWLGVRAGSHWTLDGRRVQVPDENTAQVYQAIGQFVLTDLARHIERAVDEGDAGLFETLWVSLRLRIHGVHLDLKRSSTSKAVVEWGTGNFEYVLGRLWLAAQQRIRDEEAAITAAQAAGYTLGSGWSAPNGSLRYATLHREGRELGWVALMDGRRVAADWRVVGTGEPARSNGLLQTSGAYVTKEGRTAGLSLQDGQVVNYLLDTKLGGLVVVGKDGSVRILNLRSGVRLDGVPEQLLPFEDLGDLYLLIDDLRQQRASAFQTHVLAADGKLTIRQDRSSAELRERRLLVTASYRGNPIVALIDIPGSHRMSLHEAAVVAIAALQTPASGGGPGLEVHGVANLDVGSYDILEARTDTGTPKRSGPVPLAQAMNLLRWR